MDEQDLTHDGSFEQHVDDSSNEILSSSFQSFSSENDEDLKKIAATVAPVVASLLDTNEAALEDEMAWLAEEEKFRNSNMLGSSRDSIDDEEDGINSEMNRLADAEQMLRDELEMSNLGFNFMNFIAEGEDGEQRMTESSVGIQKSLQYMNGMTVDNALDTGSRTESDGITGMYEDDEVATDNSENSSEGGGQLQSQSVQASKKNSDLKHQVRTESDVGAIDSTIEKLISSPSVKETYTLYDHAKYIGLQFDNEDLGYPSCPLLKKEDAEMLMDVPSFRHDLVTGELDTDSDHVSEADFAVDVSKPNDSMKVQREKDHCRHDTTCDIIQCTREYIKPMNSASLNRIFQGLSEGKNLFQRDDCEEDGKNKDVERGRAGVSIKSNAEESIDSQRETIPVRTVMIQIRPDVLVGAVLDAIYTTVLHIKGEVTKRQGGHLRALIPGQWIPEHDYTPFRRDDEELRGIAQLFGSPLMHPSPGAMNGMIFLPPFVVDAQLCTRRKSRYAERMLLVRFFSISDGQILDNGSAVCPRSPPHAPSKAMQRSSSGTSSVNGDETKEPNNILRESSSLLQRMRSVAIAGGNIAFDLDDEDSVDEEREGLSNVPSTKRKDTNVMRSILTSPLKLFSPSSSQRKRVPRKNTKFDYHFDRNRSHVVGVEAAQKIASNRLISNFDQTPSVHDEVFDIDPIAALNPTDWPFIQSSWRFMTDCLNELDNRDLAFSTLVSCPFGAFPALPTLDVHYCSQIRDICKDLMLSSLIKSAQELEIYAREAEAKCHRMMQILKPMFVTYEEDPPDVPEPIPVSSYPLDFIPPEVASPPWGIKVVEALNLIAAKSPSIHSGFHDVSPRKLDSSSDATIGATTPKSARSKSKFQGAKDAVNMVFTAFQKQEDEELSARIGRKNCQVMDRLAKMQAFTREAMVAIRSSYGVNMSATKAANKVHNYVKELANAPSSDEIDSCPSSSEQVPLLTCRIICGGSSGICYVTYHELLLVTQNIPLVGGNYFTHVVLNDVTMEVQAGAGKKSRLNPIPSMLVVRRKSNNDELFSFRPSTGAHLFKDFIDTIAEVKSESPEAVDFNSEGGLINMFHRKASVERAALGEEHIPDI